MAFDRDKLYQQAQTAITENNLFFIEDIVAFIPCSKPTFYEYFPIDSNEFNNLKGLLEQNKIRTKIRNTGKAVQITEGIRAFGTLQAYLYTRGAEDAEPELH